ncbi:hypothetical protein DLH72_04895 [Candidatus Gracilibacteria bacterium]|nr:MAG: hypothetical protein DLH72_04895 [Candidatus Gracilibacteria bacterium]
MDTLNRIKELERLIIQAKKSYYSFTDDTDEQQLTDAEFDLLEEELRQLDPNNVVLRQVGYEDTLNSITNKIKVTHTIPMLSMDKVKKKEDLLSWFNNKIDSGLITDYQLVVEPKVDGVSGDLLYSNTKFQYAATRGNGRIGLKIDTNLIKNTIKSTIPIKGSEIHIRGEFYIPKSYNLKKERDDYEPLRNLCAGALKRKEPIEINKYIEFIPYNIIGTDITFDKEIEKLELLRKTKYPDIQYFITKDITHVWEYFEEYEKSLRNKWSFESDGLVVVFNSINTQKIIVQEFGDTDHHHKYAIAIKPKSVGAWSTIRDVEFNVSRNGRIVPVAIMYPVQIGSVMVSRATLNNMSFVKENNIQLYDKVFCNRTNDVIPDIVKVIHTTKSKEVTIEKCPSCGTKLVEKGVDYICPNHLNCPAQIVNKFLHWFTSNDIKHIGPSSIDKLIHGGNFSSLWQLYAMNQNDLMCVIEKYCNISKDTDTMKEFIRLFEKSKDQTEQDIIGKYGIPTIGIKMLKKMNIYTLNDLIKYKDLSYMSSDVAVEKNICIWLNQDPRNFDDLFSLIKYIDPKKKVDKNIKKKLFCITGALDNLSRNDAIKEIENKYPNYEYSNTVTKDVSILYIGNDATNTSKYKTAVKYNIPIIEYKSI